MFNNAEKYRVWYRHSGEKEIEGIPDYDDMTYRVMTFEEIELDKGENSITHLSIEKLKNIPSWLAEIAPDLMQLELSSIDTDSLRQDKVDWSR